MGIIACLAHITICEHVNTSSGSISIRSRHEASEAGKAKPHLQQDAVRSLEQQHATWLLQHVFRCERPSLSPASSFRQSITLFSATLYLAQLPPYLALCVGTGADMRLDP